MNLQITKKLNVIDGETLMDTRLPKRSFCVETLLPEGISMLGGAPKVGKSWMVLPFALQVAKGEPLWNLPTKQGTVLYLALEDSLSRLQDRLNRLTDEAPASLFFATATGTIGDELNDFYAYLRNDGLSGASAQRYHSLLHIAFKHAVKRGIILANPCDQADRPKAKQYIASYYNQEEIKQLLECLDNEPMRIAVILTAYYGLRRSEVLGIKWSAIDWTKNKITIRHKVIENKLEGGRIEGHDVMKTKSSYRSLPLIPQVKEILLEEKAKQESMRKLLRGAYNKKYLDYVCVDAIGDILTPKYISSHFKVILAKNGLKKIRFHDLRHSCASLLLANKVPMKMIQDWLGHSDMSTTANIYSHVDHTSKLESAKVIGNLLGA